MSTKNTTEHGHREGIEYDRYQEQRLHCRGCRHAHRGGGDRKGTAEDEMDLSGGARGATPQAELRTAGL